MKNPRGMKLTLTAMFAAIAVVNAAAQSPSPTAQKLTLSGGTMHFNRR